MNIYVYDNVLEDPDSYVKEVLLNGFEDVQIGEDLFTITARSNRA